MPKDTHRINHRGAHGLFDDIDEIGYTEAHELHHVQKASRRQAHQSNKEARMAERIARGKPAESKLSCLFAKVLPRRDRFERFDHENEGLPKGIEITVNGKPIMEKVPVYQNDRGWDTGAVESPWLKECGMIRVKSDNPGGCHIVAKPFILRDN